MAQGRLTEWLDRTKSEIPAYHRDQFRHPKESTKAFLRALSARNLVRSNTTVLDLACGAGAATGYFARHYPATDFAGVDIDERLIAWGRTELADLPNVRLETGDLYQLPERMAGAVDGVIFLQTLSWLPEPEAPLRAIAKLKPRWIACSSLFYDGPVSCTIQVRDASKPAGDQPYVDTFYNVYALDSIRRLLASEGFERVDAEPFELGIDLPQPADKGMGTYTERLADGRRLSISGPLLMPWHFVFAER
jgi:SAM-dependent methyltransferase